MLLYGSANRDERRYAEPDNFEVKRRAVDQLGWDSGVHLCAGMNLARIEMEVLLETLVDHVDYLAIGEPMLSENRGLYGYTQLPLSLQSA